MSEGDTFPTSITINPPYKDVHAETDKNSDESDNKAFENLHRLPRRILLSLCSINIEIVDDAQNFISILEKRLIIATSSKGRRIPKKLRILEKGKAVNFQVVNVPIPEQPNDNVLLKSLLNPIIPFSKFSPDKYFLKILKALNDLMQYVQLYVADPNLRIYKKLDYEKLSLKTFQLRILEPYRSFLIHFELNTLEECLNKCRLYDNRKQEEQYYDYVRGPLKKPQPMQHQSFKTHYSFQKSPQTFSILQKPHQPFYNAQRPQNSFNTQNTRPNFYSQFNNQPKPFSGSINKPITQSFRNFTNKQVFGNPKPIIPQSQYKPSPTSGISTFTNNKIKPPQNFDQSSSNPRRNFISEELNNVEPEQLEVVQDELEEIYQGDHIQDDYDQKEDENFWEPASNFPTTI
ncbi:hypothetical protein FQA39_LY15993 [Lamprigera yunnana]|nr:hypothetical protein FQA39_LY15993 [Lamprigera yunnana]